MSRFLFVNPPLVLDEDFIDYPYFANHGLLACAGLAAKSGARVEIHDAFARPNSGRHRREQGGFILGVEHEEWDLNDLEAESFSSKVVSVETGYVAGSALYQALLLALTLIGAAIGARKREPWVVVPAVAFAYLVVISCGLETHARFRVPLVPVLAVLASRALLAAGERFGSRAARR